MQPLYFVQNQQKGAQNLSALLLFLRNGGLPCDNIRPERPVSSRLRRQNPCLCSLLRLPGRCCCVRTGGSSPAATWKMQPIPCAPVRNAPPCAPPYPRGHGVFSPSPLPAERTRTAPSPAPPAAAVGRILRNFVVPISPCSSATGSTLWESCSPGYSGSLRADASSPPPFSPQNIPQPCACRFRQ